MPSISGGGASSAHWARTARPMSGIVVLGIIIYGLATAILMQTNLLADLGQPNSAVARPNAHNAAGHNRLAPSAEQTEKESEPCEYNPASRIRSFGSFNDLPVNACALAVESMPVPEHLTYDTVGYRLPFYDSYALWIYRCRLVSAATVGLMEAQRTKFDDEDVLKAQRNCTTSGSINAILEYFIHQASVGSFAKAKTAIEKWIRTTDEGKLGLEALNRIVPLTDIRTNRDFALLAQQKEWMSHSPSEVGQRLFPDVNTHQYMFPQKQARILTVKNARVEKNGRVASENMEIFYPRRAPYSHIALMESFADANSKRLPIKFVPNQRARKQMEATIRADQPQRSKCLSQLKNNGEKVSCGFSDIAVAKVFVTSQTLGNQMFHYLCENLPRLGLHLDALREDPSVYIHVSCPESSAYCIPLLELLGIKKERILVRPSLVLAKSALVPEGGRRHWPFGNLWGLRGLRHAVLSRYFRDEKRHSVSKSNVVRVLIIKRSMTRLNGVTSKWYDMIKTQLSLDSSLIFNFPRIKLAISLFDDGNKEIMKDAYSQIKAIRDADIIIGAHGAALSWITYARERSHFISFRSRSNSDIYEHLAAMFGQGFHHVLFREKFDLLYKEMRFTVSNAVSELIDKDELKDPVFASVACIRCHPSKAAMMARYFDLVVLFDVYLPDDAETLPQNVVLASRPLPKPDAGDTRQCYGHLYEELIDQAREYVKGKPHKLYYGWVKDDDVMISPSFKRFWVTLEQFDALFLTNSMEAEQPVAAFFAEGLRHPLCFEHGKSVKEVAESTNLEAIAIIVASNQATALITNGRLFRTIVTHSEEERANWLNLVRQISRQGEYSLLEESLLRDVRALEYYIAIRVKVVSQEWRFRSPPVAAFRRGRPNAATLGYWGDVRMIEMPLASFSGLQCNLPSSALDDESLFEDC